MHSPRTATFLALTLACALLTPGGAVASASAPDDWDERIKPLVEFVEKDRGLEFEHPVRVEFLGERAFKRRLLRDEEDLTRQDRRDLEEATTGFRSVGLLTGDIDVFSALSDLRADHVYGFYDLDTKSMVVRGTKLRDVETRATLVHELTHALQDQHYAIGRQYDRLDDKSGPSFAFDALTEGEATYVGATYVDSLPAREQAYYGTEDSEADTGEPGQLADDVPKILALISVAPYELGASFVLGLDAIGKRELERAHRHPPASEEQVIDFAAWASRDRPLKVDTPVLLDGDDKRGQPDTFGALGLYLTLASRIDPAVALDAATGWGGDRSQLFSRNGSDCLRAAFRGDTELDSTEIFAGLEAWAAALPPGMASTEVDGETITVTSCAAPDVSEPDADQLDRAMFALSLGQQLSAGAMFGGLSPKAASCVGRLSVTTPELAAFTARLYDEETTLDNLPPSESRHYQQLLGHAAIDCGA